MVTSHLRGRWRVLRDIAGRTLRLGLNADAIKFLQSRMGLSSADLLKIQDGYSHTASVFTAAWSQKIVHDINRSISESTASGEHVQAAMKRLHQAFISNGISATNPWVLETIVRTQTQIAYSAGRENGLRDPAIQEILWGFEYVTVGDDRVRATHAAMDGVRRPKTDAVWQQWTPPCGWNCRCSKLPILKHETKLTNDTSIPTQTKDAGGKIISVQPDVGFGKNWGNVHRDHFATPTFGVVGRDITAAVLDNDAQKVWEASLTPQQKQAFHDWSFRWDRKMRAVQRGQSVDQEAKSRVNAIESALVSAPRYRGTVYRGVHDLPLEIFKKLKVGQIIGTSAFTSAARDFDTALGFTGTGWTPGVIFKIQTEDAVSIEKLGVFTDEKEMLLAKGQKFRVAKIEEITVGEFHKTVVELEQVKNETPSTAILRLSQRH